MVNKVYRGSNCGILFYSKYIGKWGERGRKRREKESRERESERERERERESEGNSNSKKVSQVERDEPPPLGHSTLSRYRK